MVIRPTGPMRGELGLGTAGYRRERDGMDRFGARAPAGQARAGLRDGGLPRRAEKVRGVAHARVQVAKYWSGALVVAAGLTGSVAYSVQGPTMGAMSAEAGYGSFQEGLVVGVFYAAAAVGMLIGARTADSRGTRGVILAGFVLLAIGSAASGTMPAELSPILLGRGLAGFGAGLGFVAGAEHVRRVSKQPGLGAVVGFYGASFPAGSILTLVCVPSMDDGGPWRAAYLVSGAMAAGFAMVWMVASPDLERQQDTHADLARALRTPRIYAYALVHSCGFGLSMALSAWLPLYWIRGHGMSGVWASLLSSLSLVAMLLGRLLGGWTDARRAPTVIRLSLLVAAIGVSALAIALLAPRNLGMVIGVLGVCLAGAGSGLPYSQVIFGAGRHLPKSPTSAQAVIGCAAIGFAAVGPIMLGAVLDVTGDLSPAFLVIAGYVASVGLLASRWISTPGAAPDRCRRAVT